MALSVSCPVRFALCLAASSDPFTSAPRRENSSRRLRPMSCGKPHYGAPGHGKGMGKKASKSSGKGSKKGGKK